MKIVYIDKSDEEFESAKRLMSLFCEFLSELRKAPSEFHRKRMIKIVKLTLKGDDYQP